MIAERDNTAINQGKAAKAQQQTIEMAAGKEVIEDALVGNPEDIPTNLANLPLQIRQEKKGELDVLQKEYSDELSKVNELMAGLDKSSATYKDDLQELLKQKQSVRNSFETRYAQWKEGITDEAFKRQRGMYGPLAFAAKGGKMSLPEKMKLEKYKHDLKEIKISRKQADDKLKEYFKELNKNRREQDKFMKKLLMKAI